jgi:hypothetical protein
VAARRKALSDSLECESRITFERHAQAGRFGRGPWQDLPGAELALSTLHTAVADLGAEGAFSESYPREQEHLVRVVGDREDRPGEVRRVGVGEPAPHDLHQAGEESGSEEGSHGCHRRQRAGIAVIGPYSKTQQGAQIGIDNTAMAMMTRPANATTRAMPS